jgi:ABC-2 type transport system ATP-binding protein
LIQIQGLGKKFGAFAAVEGLDLEVKRGEVFGFLGPNGAGKTTTIKMATGLLRPDQGRVLIDGVDIALEPERAKRRLGYVPDRPELFGYLSARETLLLSGGLYGLGADDIRARGFELLKAFGMEDWLDERVGNFSHGMKQKLILCAALLHRPSVLILDEPMVGLDPKGGRQVKELLRLLAGEGMCIFLSIHGLEVAEKLCDRLGILLNGRLLALGSTAEIQALAGSGGGALEDAFLSLTGEGGDAALGLEAILRQLKP